MAVKKQDLVGSLDKFYEHKLVWEGKMATEMAGRNYLEEKMGIKLTERNTASFNRVIRRVTIRVRNRYERRKALAVQMAERVFFGMTGAEEEIKKYAKYALRCMMKKVFDPTKKTEVDNFVIMLKELRQMPFLDLEDISVNADKPIPGVKYKS